MTKFLIVAMFCAPGWLFGGVVRYHAPARHPTPTVHATATPPPTMTPLPTSTPLPTATAVPTATAIPSDDPVLYLLGLVNAERQSHGIAPIVLNPTQSACSLAHSVHMAAEGYISHDQFPSDICVPWSAVSENVGEASGPERSAILFDFDQMIAEPYAPGCVGSHHCSIDGTAYHQIGIGIYQSGELTYVTEDFVG